jgi:hypothetical protein
MCRLHQTLDIESIRGARAADARTPRPGMPAALLEDGREVLPDELRTRDAAFAGSTVEQPIIVRIQQWSPSAWKVS